MLLLEIILMMLAAAVLGRLRARWPRFAFASMPSAPGSTETPMTADYDDEMRRNVVQRSLVGRMSRLEDIAAVAIFLISDAAGYMTGEIVNVNGGGAG
jgi:NAD(P)-dependent dehydrogenase (short-subunit alcohol dehydrogenase family)